MDNQNNQLDQLLERLNVLVWKQEEFAKEITVLRNEIGLLKRSQTTPEPLLPEPQPEPEQPAKASAALAMEDAPIADPRPERDPVEVIPPKQSSPLSKTHDTAKSDLEKFVGENLINKIGIAITVIGVAIGAKYSIEHELISPLTRIILGYLAGIGLLGFGMKLKKKYEGYSAVLVSGAMAIMFFMTYAAYSFYALLPQAAAFVIMVLFTAFTVFAALQYNRQLIALLGLVGAYAVPFLLSEGSGKAGVFFTYVAIMNAGILVIAIRKSWKPLFLSAFALTWLLYSLWFVSDYSYDEHFALALSFLVIYFAIFYLTLLVYKVSQKENFTAFDLILLLANSFIGYGIGYDILNLSETGSMYLGLFTLANALVHFIVGVIIYRKKMADRKLFYLVNGLVLVFITMAIPVQLDGNWVTLIWAGEAALLFWIGRGKGDLVFERFSYVLMLLAFFSIVQDWLQYDVVYLYGEEVPAFIPVWNIRFLSSLLFAGIFGFIHLYNLRNSSSDAAEVPGRLAGFMAYAIPGILLCTLYYTFRLEISGYWNHRIEVAELAVNTGDGLSWGDSGVSEMFRYKTIWILNYSLLFFSLLGVLNMRKIRNGRLALINLGLMVFTLMLFLFQGLYTLSLMREHYLEQVASMSRQPHALSFLIRYVSLAIACLTLTVGHRYIRQDFVVRDFQRVFDLLLHATVIWILSSELIHWMDLADSAQSYKLGLSILWGSYALFLIALGIRNRKRYLRVGAMIGFGITLLKLFFYDISHLDTLAKTIVMVSLGILLLIISFLYNKFKHMISDEVAV